MSNATRFLVRKENLIPAIHNGVRLRIDPHDEQVVLAADYDRDLAAMTAKRDALAQAVDRIAKERDALTARLAACREALDDAKVMVELIYAMSNCTDRDRILKLNEHLVKALAQEGEG